MTKDNKTILYKILITLFIVVCFCGIVYFAHDLIVRNSHINENNNIKEKIDDQINIPKQSQTQEEPVVKIDFEALKSENADVVAYVKVNNTNIDYVVVQSDDNDYYLYHNFERNWNTAGWVFADFRNKLDDTDKNIIIYGHNIRDGSMFGTLENILNEEWYKNKDNYKILFVTEKGIYNYQVFSVYSTVPEDYYISTEFENEVTFETFINEIKNRSIYDFETEVTAKDKILTLSSCLGAGEKRVVLHAKLLEV